MNTDKNNIEELRKNWRRLSIEAPAFGGAPETPRLLPTSEKQRVARRLRILSVAGVLFMLYMLLCLKYISYPAWLVIAYEIFMGLTVFLNLFMLRKLNKADLAVMTTVDAIEFIRYFTKLRNRCKIFLITLAVPLVAMIIWVSYDAGDHNCVIGGIAGGIIGGLIGLNIDRKFRRDLKTMAEVLGDE